jgi:ubiquinone/menaquinone biosynthesis C-methylase UbiE
MTTEKELAYRYDLFIAPEWRSRFDALLGENIEIPAEGEILEVNCGTGSHALEIAERLKDKGEVLAVDSSAERLELARAKALVTKLQNVRFEQAVSGNLPFPSDKFDAVIGDASLIETGEMEATFAELVRVARPGARVTIMLATHGSFDEFFSIYWEALMDAGLVDKVWENLEVLIRERGTVSDAEAMASRLGLNDVESVTSKEEFDFETGSQFLESPVIADPFLPEWLSIIPPDKWQEVTAAINRVIERERHQMAFDVSVKAALITGIKQTK